MIGLVYVPKPHVFFYRRNNEKTKPSSALPLEVQEELYEQIKYYLTGYQRRTGKEHTRFRAKTDVKLLVDEDGKLVEKLYKRGSFTPKPDPTQRRVKITISNESDKDGRTITFEAHLAGYLPSRLIESKGLTMIIDHSTVENLVEICRNAARREFQDDIADNPAIGFLIDESRLGNPDGSAGAEVYDETTIGYNSQWDWDGIFGSKTGVPIEHNAIETIEEAEL